MDKVHTRSNDHRVVLQMNERFQPISDNDKISSELSNFLGTLVKRCVPFTYVSWRDVPEALKNTMWNYVRVSLSIFFLIQQWYIFFSLLMYLFFFDLFSATVDYT